MIIYVNEDGAYRSWIVHHRHGYVLDGQWKNKLRSLVLHRATCKDLRHSPGKTAHATTHGQFKACASNLDELLAWVEQRAETSADLCSQCHPTVEPASEPVDGPHHLSLLAARMLDYVLDVTVICLENPPSKYELTISDVAQCLRKTPAQLSDAIRRLIEGGLISVVAPAHRSHAEEDRLVFPTAAALKTLPFFSAMPAARIDAEIDRLTNRVV